MELSGQKDFLKKSVAEWKKAGESIGFVPTMGALHQGHLDLIAAAQNACKRVVVSIFVNPLQFNNPDDLLRYPKDPDGDADLLRKAGVDLLYMPEASDFYPEPSRIRLEFGAAGEHLEGKMRPGHFSGVGVVLARLFHLVQPDKAFFGAKDLQQVAIVNILVRDLGFPLEIIRCPTRREANGLAMSSRNLRLSEAGRELASRLYESLQLAIAKGPGQAAEARETALSFLRNFPEINIEYLHWVDAQTMEIWSDFRQIPAEPAICLAAWVEGVRLIDNLIAVD